MELRRVNDHQLGRIDRLVRDLGIGLTVRPAGAVVVEGQELTVWDCTLHRDGHTDLHHGGLVARERSVTGLAPASPTTARLLAELCPGDPDEWPRDAALRSRLEDDAIGLVNLLGRDGYAVLVGCLRDGGFDIELELESPVPPFFVVPALNTIPLDSIDAGRHQFTSYFEGDTGDSWAFTWDHEDDHGHLCRARTPWQRFCVFEAVPEIVDPGPAVSLWLASCWLAVTGSLPAHDIDVPGRSTLRNLVPPPSSVGLLN